MKSQIIGLAGYRCVGKSLIAQHLRKNHGFKLVHPFELWKEGLKTIYQAIGIDEKRADAMLYGDLKDVPMSELPDGHDSRYLMERLGKFTGQELGPEWTLGLALQRMKILNPNCNLVMESIVYEVDVVRRFGGHLVMVERPGTEGKGLMTDQATKSIIPDSIFVNDGNDIEKLGIDFDKHLYQHGLMTHDDTRCPL